MEREIHSSSLPRRWKSVAEISVGATASAACFDIIPAPLEYFGHATTARTREYYRQDSDAI